MCSGRWLPGPVIDDELAAAGGLIEGYQEIRDLGIALNFAVIWKFWN